MNEWEGPIMFKNIVMGIALMLGVGAGLAPAQSYGTMRRGDQYERLAIDWVRLYLRRNPTPQELLLMTTQLRSGMDPNAIQPNILSSNEHIRRSGNSPNAWPN